MFGRRPAHPLALAVALGLLVPVGALASPGDVSTPYDGHDTVAATATPYASTAPFASTLTYDSSAFTTTETERDDDGPAGIYTNMTGCSGSPPWWGGRSGWVRFDSAVKGTLRIDVSTAGYDPILVVWNGPSVALNTTPFASMLNQDCNAVRSDSQESITNIGVSPNRPIHIATLGFCGRAAYWTASATCTSGSPFDDLDAKSPGGPTSVSLSFQCDNDDGDAACDTLDACPSISGAQNGCPDRDRDGTLDGADACPDVAGTEAGCPPDQDGDAIANASDACPTQQGYPPSGCPDGDGDGVFFPSDQCPDARGIATDGCPDSDGDGVSDRTDACASVFGAASNGCLAVLGAAIRWDFVTRSFRLKRLRVQTLRGAEIDLRCSAKRKPDCPVSKRTYTAGTPARDFKSLFRNRSLRRRPFTLTFRVTKRGYLGTYKRYTYDGRNAPRTLERCIALSGKLERCPG